MEVEPSAKKSKMDENSSNFENFVANAPSSAYTCFYFLVGDPNKGTPEMIAASKLHLMAHSVPLRKMLEESEIAEKGTVTLIDIEPETFKNFIRFVNRCDIVPTLCFEEAVSLMYVAEKYIVEDLKTKLGKHLASVVTIDNVYLPMVRPECFQEETLKGAIDTIIQQKTVDLVNREEYLQLNAFGVSTIVEQKVLALTEIQLWQALLTWAKHTAQSEEGSKLREILAEPIKQVRFCTLDVNNFIKEVCLTEILDDAEVISIIKAMGGKTEFVKSPSICYELIKRDFFTNDLLNIDLTSCGFTKVDRSISSYIYLTTKSQRIWLIQAEVETGIQSPGYVDWPGQVFLTKIIDGIQNTSSAEPVSYTFTSRFKYSNETVSVDFPNTMTLDAESKYKLEFSSSNQFQRYRSDQDDCLLDRNGLVISMNKDCPATHFKTLSYKTLS